VVEADTLDSFKAQLSIGQLSSKFTTVFILLTCTVHRRHPPLKSARILNWFALHPEEEEEEISEMMNFKQ